MDVIELKKELRKTIKATKKHLSEKDRMAQSDEVFLKLEQLDSFKNSANVLCYWSLADELETTRFIDKWSGQKNIYLPKVNGSTMSLHLYINQQSMIAGDFNIMEPTGVEFCNWELIDFVVVPGIAFSKKCSRLGRGGGYYDRLLPQLSNAIKIGVGYNFQLVNSIPSEKHDVIMDAIITPKQ